MKLPMIFSVTVALLFGLNGCSEPAETESSQPSSSADENGHEEHGDHEEGHDDDHAHEEEGDSAMTDMEKMKAALAEFSPEDAASAEKQHICPVSDEMLGAMGAPIKIDVDGQQVWICCEGCRDPLLEDPAKYLAKLENL